jgi:molybdopterin-binding protein
MKISARNMLKGKVKEIKTGVVNSEVIIETLSGETIVSIITKDSVDSLKLHVGMDVYAVIKASNIMVAVD